MQRYIYEFCFRQNTRKHPVLEVFYLLLVMILKFCAGVREGTGRNLNGTISPHVPGNLEQLLKLHILRID
jgi:hypothetical protein